MNVMVVGATGTLGRPTVRALLQAGHEVVGVTRSLARAGELEDAGARSLTFDVLDPQATAKAVKRVRPDAILALLSARPLPGLTRFREFGPTVRLWRTGTRNLVEAAAAGGVSRVVAESVIFAYGYGDVGDAVTENHPREGGALWAGHRSSLRAMREMEQLVLHAAGVVVRMGILYGRGVPSTEFMRHALLANALALPAPRRGTVPLISWIEGSDAARARVAALEAGRPGQSYNVVDNHPASFYDFTEELASRIGARPPARLPYRVVFARRPHAAMYIGGTRLTASNEKGRRELRWQPNFPTIEEGLSEFVRERPPER